MRRGSRLVFGAGEDGGPRDRARHLLCMRRSPSVRSSTSLHCRQWSRYAYGLLRQRDTKPNGGAGAHSRSWPVHMYRSAGSGVGVVRVSGGDDGGTMQ